MKVALKQKEAQLIVDSITFNITELKKHIRTLEVDSPSYIYSERSIKELTSLRSRLIDECDKHF